MLPLKQHLAHILKLSHPEMFYRQTSLEIKLTITDELFPKENGVINDIHFQNNPDFNSSSRFEWLLHRNQSIV